MSTFRDTFTKDDSENTLNYDDSASLFFLGAVLTAIVVPWTIREVWNFIFPDRKGVAPSKDEDGNQIKYCKVQSELERADQLKKEAAASRWGAGRLVKFAVLGGLWYALSLTMANLQDVEDVQSFDPFKILGVSTDSSDKDIKKAYRKLSLVYHPDKNPDNPLAAAQFIQITKAYAALTDETAKANYEKYGNPDGPQTMKVGIGLPRFLLAEGNKLAVLMGFFILILFAVPLSAIVYFQKHKGLAANGMYVETMQLLGRYVREGTAQKACPELLAASYESRAMATRASDNADMQPLIQQVVQHKKVAIRLPVAQRNQFLILGHMQRLHDLMSNSLQKDLDAILRFANAITKTMVEVATMRDLLATATAMLEFRRCLIQGLDVKQSAVAQVPHATDDVLRLLSKGKQQVTDLHEFLRSDLRKKKAFQSLSDDQFEDIEEFTRHLPDLEVDCRAYVVDEDDVVVGDVVTLELTLTRKHLQEGSAQGPVFAPLYPDVISEEWWIFVCEKDSPKICAFDRIKDPQRVVTHKLRFRPTSAGKKQLLVHLMHDSYAGVDRRCETGLRVLAEKDVKRPFIVHEEDRDLDAEPSAFQSWMGLQKGEESSDDEGDSPQLGGPMGRYAEEESESEDSDSDSE